MNAVIAALRAPGAAEQAFSRAIRDPRVRRAAQSLHVDLSDGRHVAVLLARARKALDAPAFEAIDAGAVLSGAREDELASIGNHHARHAIRTYLAVQRAG